MEQKIKPLGETQLTDVTGGAQVVEVNANDKYIPRCFNCHSKNLTIEVKTNKKVVTCNDCGAVDIMDAG